MWRLILISFAVLAAAFYELSGGADYAPAPNSIQARADLARPQARPAPEEPGTRARTLAEVEAVMEGLEDTRAETEDLSVTLAAARTDGLGIIAAEASRPKAELLDLLRAEPPAPEGGGDPSIEAAIAAAIGEVTVDPAQFRWVKDNLVDLRAGPGLSFDRITTLTKGTEVGILEDPGHGWLKVKVMNGYESGWLAEWLLTAPQ